MVTCMVRGMVNLPKATAIGSTVGGGEGIGL